MLLLLLLLRALILVGESPRSLGGGGGIVIRCTRYTRTFVVVVTGSLSVSCPLTPVIAQIPFGPIVTLTHALPYLYPRLCPHCE